MREIPPRWESGGLPEKVTGDKLVTRMPGLAIALGPGLRAGKGKSGVPSTLTLWWANQGSISLRALFQLLYSPHLQMDRVQ